jgi:pimeloyl-ACP methyl ester carboxylesterase
MDERFCMVASSGWTTSYLRDIENGMPADNEQYPPGLAAAGLDKVDFFMARAGEPTLLLGQMRDIFDDRGLRSAYRELRRMHRAMGGAAGHCRLRMDEQEHTLSVMNQRDMVRFFNTVLGRPNRREQPSAPPSEAELLVTVSGQVVRHGSRPLYRLVGERAAAISAQRTRLAPEDLARTIRQALGVRPPARRPDHRRMFQTTTRRSQTQQDIHRFIFEPEPGIVCVLRHVCHGKLPHRMDPDAAVCLYLPNLCSGQELARKGVMPGRRDYWALDVRGLGESAYSDADFFSHYGQYYMAAGHAVMFGESLLGAQTFDVLSALALLRAEGARTVHLMGRGQGGVLALLAGCLDPAIETVVSLGAPESIAALCRSPLCEWPTSLFPFDVLRRFDLPDLRRALGRRLIRSTTSSPRYFRA